MIPEVILTGWEENTKILQTPNKHVRHGNANRVNIFRKSFMWIMTMQKTFRVKCWSWTLWESITFFQHATTKISWYMLLTKIVSCLWNYKKWINYLCLIILNYYFLSDHLSDSLCQKSQGSTSTLQKEFFCKGHLILMSFKM